ncbi:HAD-IA family hydrolase [Erysipelothrix sp. D19-032]
MLVGLFGYLGGFQKIIGKPKPIILWDFDGTLGNTQELIIKTFKKVFEIHKPDYNLSDEEVRSFLGPTLEDTFMKHFDANRVDAIIDEYREINIAMHADYVTEMEHATEVLTALKNDGYRMGIVSNKQTASLMVGVELLEMQDFFEVVLGSDLFNPEKPDPAGIDLALEQMNVDKGGVIYIGDTPSDIIAGRRAGSFTIGYVFDKMREKELRETNPNRVIDDLREVQEILKEDHEWTITMM